MSAQTYEPLRVVPPLDTSARMGWLLAVRQAALRALDAALAVPRRAAEYIGRLAHWLHVSRGWSWLRSAAARLGRPLLSLAGRLGRTGVLAGVTSVLTSPTGQAVLRKVGGFLGRAFGWVARKTYSLLDRTLRCFGKTGNKAADALFNGAVSLGGKLASVAAPVVHRVARFTDAQTPQARLLNGIARSYVLHRVAKALIANPYVRLLVEGFVIPALVDSRVGQWFRTQVRTMRQRATSLREQAQPLSQPVAAPTKVVPATDIPAGAYDPPLAAGEDVAMPLWLVEEPMPNNRAERRAQQRQQNRHPRQ